MGSIEATEPFIYPKLLYSMCSPSLSLSAPLQQQPTLSPLPAHLLCFLHPLLHHRSIPQVSLPPPYPVPPNKVMSALPVRDGTTALTWMAFWPPEYVGQYGHTPIGVQMSKQCLVCSLGTPLGPFSSTSRKEWDSYAPNKVKAGDDGGLGAVSVPSISVCVWGGQSFSIKQSSKCPCHKLEF